MAPPPRMSGNSEVWHGAQTAQASFQTNVRGVACALIKIEDVDNRREGDKHKGCHVCWDWKKEFANRNGHASAVTNVFAGRALVKDASRSILEPPASLLVNSEG